MSRTPIQSIRASATTTCRLADGSLIAVNQLLKDSAGTKNSTRFCKGGGMQINGYSYEGTLELVRSQNAWLAVNEVRLKNYVASVVGAEMPSGWHGEALKAQAVAARSYAVTHLARPASLTYHLLGHTPDGRCFRGLQASVSNRCAQRKKPGEWF